MRHTWKKTYRLARVLQKLLARPWLNSVCVAQVCVGKIKGLKLFCPYMHCSNQRDDGNSFGERLTSMGRQFAFKIHYFKSAPISASTPTVSTQYPSPKNDFPNMSSGGASTQLHVLRTWFKL